METAIDVDRLSKTFSSPETYTGIAGTIKALFRKRSKKISAISDLSFKIKTGERVAFIGPNGAGKSTTIKMLTGILHPSKGKIEVLGHVPWKERRALSYEIGTVFGQRTQLWYHLPPLDTFNLLSKIYEIDPKVYKRRLKEFIVLFEIEHLLDKPVKKLSLGERMRCEIVASLLHGPKILFLDEPTIGLDINAKLMIRTLLNTLSKSHGTTLFLTSHDTADIEQVCERVLVLDKGSLIMDSSLRDLKKTYMKQKILTLTTEEGAINIQLPGIRILEKTPHFFRCEVDTQLMPTHRVIEEALKSSNIKDLTIEDPSMDEVIRLVYKTKAVSS